MGSRLFVRVLLIVAIVIGLLAAFIFGTMVGFDMATKNLQTCAQVPCKTLGVDAAGTTRCELCEDSGPLFRVSR